MAKALTTTSGALAALDTVETDPRLLMSCEGHPVDGRNERRWHAEDNR